MTDNLTPYQIKSKDGLIWIVDERTNTDHPKFPNTLSNRKWLVKMQAKYNSRHALDMLGIN